MRLADFIETNMQPIVAEWVTFAETCSPVGRAMDPTELRDHAVQMLEHIVVDLRTPQSKTEQTTKAKGHARVDPRAADTAAQVHGAGRAESGFTSGEMVAEYRALRASVIRLWTVANGTLTGADLEDLMRFNEAIDQSVAESIERFSGDLDRSKEMFLAVLGHDLQSPLGAVVTASQFMLDRGQLEEPELSLTTRIVRSGLRMNHMVSDLIDFTRSRLGSGIPIVRMDMDLGQAAADAVAEIKDAHPESDVHLNASGDLRGTWDEARLGQVFANLLGNAIDHGSPKTMISVAVRGETKNVVIQVHNSGPPIPATDQPELFSPLKRLRSQEPAPAASGHLGLGLYIVERIAAAHGGTIEVHSDAAGTFFTVRLPRC